jgi:hypothetical protein
VRVEKEQSSKRREFGEKDEEKTDDRRIDARARRAGRVVEPTYRVAVLELREAWGPGPLKEMTVP